MTHSLRPLPRPSFPLPLNTSGVGCARARRFRNAMDSVIDRAQEWVSPPEIASLQASDIVARFPAEIAAIGARHRPSRMPFFTRLAALPRTTARNPALLGHIHLVYQAAMHATRAAVYYLPHLDSPALRKRKLQIFVDDDGLPGGDTHHYQLTRAFRNIGAKLVLDDEEFGDVAELSRRLDGETAQFVQLAQTLYTRSLGAWCVVEAMSVDWIRALADALSVHFPHSFTSRILKNFSPRWSKNAMPRSQPRSRKWC